MYVLLYYQSVGEPPVLMGTAIVFAIKNAIRAARADAGIDTSFRLDIPVTCRDIRMACEDNISKKVYKKSHFIILKQCHCLM